MNEKLNPRDTFTFFPDQNEQKRIAVKKGEQLKQAIDLHPDMLTQFLHELWRTNRDIELYELLKKYPGEGGIAYVACSPMHAPFTIAAMVYSPTATEVTLAEYFRPFLTDFYTIALKVEHGLKLNENLDETATGAVKDISQGIIEDANLFLLEVSAKNN